MKHFSTRIHTDEPRNVSFLFIEKMLQHERCAHFTEEQKELVRRAYELADKLHAVQSRHDGRPYIHHIDGSIEIYLNETLHEFELCHPRYLIGLILHDCIEDNDNGLIEIIKKGFDVRIIVDVLFMSKPTRRVISQVMRIKDTHQDLMQKLRVVGFIQMYDRVLENKPDKFVKNLKSDDVLSEDMCSRLKSLWRNTYQKKYLSRQDGAYRHKIYSEFIFLCLITSMYPELFRIKATERRHNMQDIDGLLREDKVKSAEGTMFTTMEIYVPRAREIGESDLVEKLIQDRNNQRARFVEAKLLEPELTGI